MAVAPGPLPLLEPDVSPPPPPRPSPPDVFAGFAPHPAALGPPTLLAEQMSVIGSRKKSVNMTECVPVPSSEHVAEIVGRQGEWPPSGAPPQGFLRDSPPEGPPSPAHGWTPDPGHAPRGLGPRWPPVRLCPAAGRGRKLGAARAPPLGAPAPLPPLSGRLQPGERPACSSLPGPWAPGGSIPGIRRLGRAVPSPHPEMARGGSLACEGG